MKLASCFLAGMLALLGPAAPAFGNGSDHQLIVDVDWLAAHAQDPNLLLLHVGDADEYRRGHIRGARLVTLDDIADSEHTRDGLMLEMPAADALRERLQKLGISDDSRIVVYFGKDWVSPSTRVLFALQHAGLGKQSSLLDGGMGAWTARGHTLSTKPASSARGTLEKLQVEPLLVDASQVRAKLGTKGTALVDARAAVYYDGIERGGVHGQVHRAGHIRGARSIPFTEITDGRLRLRPAAELRALFDQAGIAPGDTVIGYCHIGQQATAMLFAARVLGHPVRLYDGSFQDWSRAPGNPVETP